MEADRFDAWVRDLRSRRNVIQIVAGFAGVGLAGHARAVAECLGPRSSCDPAGGPRCCSERCQASRHGGKFRCAPAGIPLGCATNESVCKPGQAAVHCPDVLRDTITAFCVNDNKGKPVCVNTRVCQRCRRDADCVDAFGVLARCVKKCPSCNDQPTKSACVVPLTSADLP